MILNGGISSSQEGRIMASFLLCPNLAIIIISIAIIIKGKLLAMSHSGGMAISGLSKVKIIFTELIENETNWMRILALILGGNCPISIIICLF